APRLRPRLPAPCGRKGTPNDERRARRPASRHYLARFGLPVAACGATALTGRRARTSRAARALGDVERVRTAGRGLRDGLDGVRVRRRAGEHRDLPGAGAVAEAGGPKRGRGIAVDVGLLGRETRLNLRHHVARVGLRRRVLALLLLAQEGRQGDRGKDADDQDDDEELDQRETALLRLNTLA